LDYPSQGDIQIAGDTVSQLSSSALAVFRSRTVGFVFQAFHLIPTLTALENVGLPGVFLGLPHRDRDQRVHQIVNRRRK
jgi:putative ABC transport system ATP-binding protein